MLRWIQCKLAILLLFATPAFASNGYIGTPDECYIVSKVDGNDVYLKAAGSCKGIPGRAYVDVSGNVRVFVDGAFWKEEETQSLSIPDLNVTLKKSQDLSKAIAVPDNQFKEEMDKAASNLNNLYRSPEFQGRITAEQERLKNELFSKQMADYYPDDKKEGSKKETAGNLSQDERIYLFISSSMPVNTIRNYIASIARYHDKNIIVVLRGFVEGMSKIGPTAQFVADAQKVNQQCSGANCERYNVNIVVDPLLYRRYAITNVPAVVYARGVNRSLPDESEGLPGTTVASNTTVYGDASLEYILDLIRRETGSKSLASLAVKR